MNAPVTKIKNQRSEPQNSPSEIRTAYPFFHEKRTKNSAGVLFTKKDGTPSPRYSGTFMFPKLGDATVCPNYQWLWSLACEAARKMWPQNVDGQGNWVWPQGAQLPIRDGDTPIVPKPKPGVPLPTAEEIAKKNAWRQGYWIIEAENFLDPGPRIAKVIDGKSVELPTKVINGVEQYKSGDHGYVNLHSYAYQNETFGIGWGFDGFLFTREGERIGNSSGPKSAAQMFGNIAPPAPAGAPVQQYAPPAAPAPVAPAPATSAAPAAPAPQQYAPPAPPVPQHAAPPVAPQQYAPPAPPMAPPVPSALPPLPQR